MRKIGSFCLMVLLPSTALSLDFDEAYWKRMGGCAGLYLVGSDDGDEQRFDTLRQWAFMNAQILPSQADTWNAGVLYGEAFAEYSMRYMNIFALQSSDEDSAESYKYKHLVKLECQKLPKE